MHPEYFQSVARFEKFKQILGDLDQYYFWRNESPYFFIDFTAVFEQVLH